MFIIPALCQRLLLLLQITRTYYSETLRSLLREISPARLQVTPLTLAGWAPKGPR